MAHAALAVEADRRGQEGRWVKTPAPPASPKIRFRDGKRDAFFDAVAARVEAHFARTGRRPYADLTLVLKGAGFAAVWVCCYGAVLFSDLGVWSKLGLAILCGIFALLLAINLGHDAAHGALCRSRAVNKAIQRVTFILLGVDARLWRLRHVGSHHVFPNVKGCDADIDHNDFIRLSPTQTRRWYHRYQHLYAPLLYWLVALHTILFQDLLYLRKRQLANMRDIRHTARDYLVFALSKLAYLALFIIAPLAVLDLPAWQIILGYLIMTFVISELFVLALIGTHFAEEAAFPEVDTSGRIEGSWASHALATSVDWHPTNRLAIFFLGGANAHAAHHLFPTVCHTHYRAISMIIAAAAREHGVRYNTLSLGKLVRSHFRFLKSMGAQ